ncbi:MAG: hypothetical protein VCE12_04535 [Candidatus Latescibacterota bacterium]
MTSPHRSTRSVEKGIAPLSREGTWRTYSLEDGLAEYRFVHIAEDAKGFLWFTIAHSGVNRIDGSEFETFTTHDGFSGNRP